MYILYIIKQLSPFRSLVHPTVNDHWVAYQHWRQWLRNTNINSSHSVFSCTQLGLSTLQDWCALKVKGHDCGVLSEWLGECTLQQSRGYLADGTHLGAGHVLPSDRILAATVGAFVTIWRIYHGDAELAPPERHRLEQARQIALQGFNTLACEARAARQWRFKMRPKFHKLDHALRRSVRTGWNASMSWPFAEEDWLGHQCHMVASCHGSTLHKRAVQRWLAFWYNEIRQ